MDTEVLPAKTGRPTKYEPQLANLICNELLGGKSLRAICREHGITRSNVYQWKNCHPEFSDQYARARVGAAEDFIDQIIDIAENCPSDLAEIQKARMKIDSYKFLAMKLAPRIYGDLVKHEAGAEQSVTNVGVQVNIQINQGDSKPKQID